MWATCAIGRLKMSNVDLGRAPALAAEAGSMGPSLGVGVAPASRRQPPSPAPVPPRLPVAKLRGVPASARKALKRHRISTCAQLLAAAAPAEGRARLAQATGIAPDLLLAIVRRADLERVHGVGTIFGLMLEEIGVRDVAGFAAREPGALHRELRRLNERERLARRSPTLDEVTGWIGQAAALPVLVSY